MLIEFRLENFRSFKGEDALSMLPVNAYKEHPDNIVPANVVGSNAEGLLSAAVLYGANASGKTNLLRAVDFARGLILGVAHPGHLVTRGNFVGNEEPTAFGFSFISRGRRYEYNFSFDGNGVFCEELRVRPRGERLVYRRTRTDNGEYEVKQGSKYPGIVAKLRDYSDNGLVLGMLSKYGIEPCSAAIDWFASELLVINRESPSDYPQLLEKLRGLGEDNFKKVIDAIGAADLGITGAQLSVDDMTEADVAAQKEAADKLKAVFEALTGQKAGPDFASPGKKVTLQFRHAIDGRQVGFGFDDESLGTLTMLDLACDFMDAIAHGKTLFVDEAERSLHPVLLKNLVGLFSDRSLNVKGAQLVFTTHDLSFLSNGELRRDQIWFVDKGHTDGVSELFPLSSFSPRKDDNLMNRYLYGAYGAVPYIDGGMFNGR